MAYQLFIIAVLLLPGVLAHHYYQFFVREETLSFSVFSRIIVISICSYVFRGLIGILQGFSEENIMVYFNNVDNIIKYILLSVVSSFLFINSLIYLEQVIAPKWKKKMEKVIGMEENNHGE